MMGRRTFLTSFIGGFAGLDSDHARSQTVFNMTQARRSLVFVKVRRQGQPDAVGTGFLVSNSGFVFTANHVISPDNSGILVNIGSNFGTDIPAVRIPTGPALGDGALIRLGDQNSQYEPVQFANPEQLQVGETLYAAGFPLGGAASLASGILSAKFGPEGLWQVTIPLNSGNSGGPVFNSAGRVIGMVRGGIVNAQLINYVIPLNLLAPFFPFSNLVWPPFEGNPPTPRPIGDDINCPEITVVTGMPPIYSRRRVCP